MRDRDLRHSGHRSTAPMRVLGALALSVAAGFPLWAEIPEDAKPEVTVSAEPSEVPIGENVTVTVTTVFDPDRVKLSGTPATPTFGSFSLEDVRFGAPEKSADGRTQRIDRYEVSTLVSGTFEIPPLTIPFIYGEGDQAETGIVTTPAVPVHVRKLTPEESENLEIRGPKPQRSVEGHSSLPLVLGIAGGILAVILALVFWLLARRRRAAAIALAAQIPPDQRALPLLASLRERVTELETGNATAWMEEFTTILKDYIHGVWDIDAPDMTSTEIVYALRSKSVHPEVVGEIKPLLESADFVKFAQYPTSPTEGLDLIDGAERLIARTRPAEEGGKEAHEIGEEAA